MLSMQHLHSPRVALIYREDGSNAPQLFASVNGRSGLGGTRLGFPLWCRTEAETEVSTYTVTQYRTDGSDVPDLGRIAAFRCSASSFSRKELSLFFHAVPPISLPVAHLQGYLPNSNALVPSCIDSEIVKAVERGQIQGE